MRPEYSLNLDEPHPSNRSARLRGATCTRIGSRSGFTLMELMVTIAVIGILAAIAIPNAIAWRSNAQFNAAVREVKTTIESVRMAAIRTNQPADVFFNGTNTFDTQIREIVGGAVAPRARVTHQLAPGITVSSDNGGQLTFNNRGMATNMTVTVQHANGLSRQIIVSIVGSSRVA